MLNFFCKIDARLLLNIVPCNEWSIYIFYFKVYLFNIYTNVIVVL